MNIKPLADRVVVKAWWGIEFIASPLPVFMRASSSAVMRWGIDMPSPIKRKTYFTGFAACAARAVAETANAASERIIFGIAIAI